MKDLSWLTDVLLCSLRNCVGVQCTRALARAQIRIKKAALALQSPVSPVTTMLRVPSALLVFLAIFSLCQCHGFSWPDVGESCTELVGSRAERCEEPESVVETVRPVDEMEGFG